jgi:hypothetical protein
MRARRTDSTQTAIVSALRRAGALVLVLNAEIDILVQWRGNLTLIDCKAAKGGKPTDTQRAMIQLGWQIHFCRTPLEAYEAVGIPLRARV